MLILVFLGFLCVLCGVIFLMPKEKLQVLNEKANQMIMVMDHFLLEKHIGVGIILFLIGFVSLFLAYYYNTKVW